MIILFPIFIGLYVPKWKVEIDYLYKILDEVFEYDSSGQFKFIVDFTWMFIQLWSRFIGGFDERIYPYFYLNAPEDFNNQKAEVDNGIFQKYL